jgi:hypothetical protein
VDHIGPDFERYENTVRPRLGREADRVIERSLGGTNLDERRRQALKIGKENGNARILPLDASQYVSGGQFIKVGPMNEWIDGIPGFRRTRFVATKASSRRVGSRSGISNPPGTQRKRFTSFKAQQRRWDWRGYMPHEGKRLMSRSLRFGARYQPHASSHRMTAFGERGKRPPWSLPRGFTLLTKHRMVSCQYGGLVRNRTLGSGV